MDKGNIIEKLRELREYLEQDTIKNGNQKIKDIKYLGEISIPKEKNKKNMEPLYLVTKEIIELDEKGRKIAREVNNYYIDKQCIGGLHGEPVLREDIKPEIKENVEKLIDDVKNGKGTQISLNDLEEERIEAISKSLNVPVEKLQSIEEINLKQKLPKEEQENIVDKKVASQIKTEEETSLNQVIKGRTLENVLDLREKGITDGIKLARVRTSDVNRYTGKTINTIDSFVVIKSNGEIVVLGDDILEPDTRNGNNSSKADLTINNDGTVNREMHTTSFRIKNGNGNEFIKVGYDEVSGKEIKFSQWSPEKGEYVDTELRTQRTYEKNNDVKELLRDSGAGNREATNIIDRSNQHPDECKEKDVTLVDNNKVNDSHIHLKDKDINIYAKAICDKNNDISNIFTPREVAEKIKKYKEKNPEESFEVILEKVEEEMEADAQILSRNKNR